MDYDKISWIVRFDLGSGPDSAVCSSESEAKTVAEDMDGEPFIQYWKGHPTLHEVLVREEPVRG